MTRIWLLVALLGGSAAASAQSSLETRTGRLEELKAQLLELEGRVDAYSPAISETALELGNLYVELGFYDAALQSFERAIGVAKINRGIYSPDLVPLYELMFSTRVQAGQVDEAMALVDHLQWLAETGFDPADPAVAPVLERLALIHLAAAEQAIDSQPLAHLQKSFDNARRAAELAADDDSQLAALQIGSLTGSRLLALLDDVERDFRFNRSSNTSTLCALIDSPSIEAVCGRPPATTTAFTTTLATSNLLYCAQTSISTNAFGEREGYNFDQVTSYISRCQNGFEDQVGDINQRLRDETGRLEEIEEVLAGADFALLRGDREVAERRYLRALEVALSAGTELPSAIQPIRTGDFITGVPDLRRSESTTGTATLTLDISARGHASDVELVLAEETGISAEQLDQISRRIRSTLFRPGITSDGLVEISAASCTWDIGLDRCVQPSAH